MSFQGEYLARLIGPGGEHRELEVPEGESTIAEDDEEEEEEEDGCTGFEDEDDDEGSSPGSSCED